MARFEIAFSFGAQVSHIRLAHTLNKSLILILNFSTASAKVLGHHYIGIIHPFAVLHPGTVMKGLCRFIFASHIFRSFGIFAVSGAIV